MVNLQTKLASTTTTTTATSDASSSPILRPPPSSNTTLEQVWEDEGYHYYVFRDMFYPYNKTEEGERSLVFFTCGRSGEWLIS